MSAATANSSHTRSKSLRVPGSDSFLKRATPVTSQQGSLVHQGPSHISLFLTNLRLLDLDRREDWPGITPITFTTKDSQQNIKKRIQCVEWALYQLFSLWDPEDARDKLQPFFPPLEPLQSLNLRAALFRCLDQAKKTGILGRDAVLRKTMLDECKGERLEEVLAAFSSAIVKRAVNDNQTGHESIALRLAMENLSYTGDRTNLSALVLAHKHSLRKAIGETDQLKERYTDFSGLLKLKDRQIARRHEQLKVTIKEDENAEYISKSEIFRVQEKARKNWYGSDEWIESIIHSDRQTQNDSLLSESYDKVWKYVDKGRIGEIEDSQRQGLLQQLDARVKEQTSRYETWQNFEKSIKTRRTSAKKEKTTMPTKQAIDLTITFGSHASLQIPSNPLQSSQSWEPTPDHTELLSNLQKELAEVGKPAQYGQSSTRPTPIRERESPPLQSGASTMSIQPQDNEDDWVSNSDSDDQSVEQETPVPKARPSRLIQEQYSQASSLPEPSCEVDEISDIASESPSPTSPRLVLAISDIPSPSSPSIPSPPSPDTTTQLPVSTPVTSPSPPKPRHVLSLAERTRMSMSRSLSRTTHVEIEDFDSLPELPAPLPQQPMFSSNAAESDSAATARRHEDLLARTRLSMSNSAAVVKSAQVERRRSVKAAARKKRESYMPVRQSLAPIDGGVDREALIEAEEDVDVETVFMSRPRVKTSPASSPGKAWREIGGRVEMGSSSPSGGM